jgi:hypothetical protein
MRDLLVVGVPPIKKFRVDFENPHCWRTPMSPASTVVSLLAGGHPPAKIAISPGTRLLEGVASARLLEGVASASTKAFQLQGQIVSGVVFIASPNEFSFWTLYFNIYLSLCKDSISY